MTFNSPVSTLLFWRASPYCPITAERQNWFRLTSERQIHVIHPETNRESDPFSSGLWYSQRAKPSFTEGTSHLNSVKYSRAARFYDPAASCIILNTFLPYSIWHFFILYMVFLLGSFCSRLEFNFKICRFDESFTAQHKLTFNKSLV